MPPQPAPLRPVTPAGSVLLDVVRFGAAIAVAFGHLTGPGLSTHWPYMLTLAVDAVAIFFVLSGFVIRLISKARHMTATSYAVDRFSRIYSVLLPALLFTIAVVACLHVFPSSAIAAPADSLRSLAFQFLACATFTGSLWGLDVPMSFNSVFWSLSYEWSYYTFYAVAFFARGKFKWIALLALALLVGPPILFLLPLWLFGCALYDIYQWLRASPRPLTMYFGALCAAALLTFLVGLAWFAARHCSLASSLSAALQQLRHWTATHHLHLLQRASFDAYLVGIPAGILILGFLLVLDRVSLSRDHPSLKIIRRIADGTFALYLFHLPIFLLFAAYIPYNRASSWQKLSIFAATIAIAVALAIPLDLLKRWLRATAPRSLHLTQPSA